MIKRAYFEYTKECVGLYYPQKTPNINNFSNIDVYFNKFIYLFNDIKCESAN